MRLSISCWPAVVPALDALVGLARAVEAEYRALKAGQSALDNNDLLRMAYEALRDYPAIRAAYEGRFKDGHDRRVQDVPTRCRSI